MNAVTDQNACDYRAEERLVSITELPDRWWFENPRLAHLNYVPVRYKVVTARAGPASIHAVFYLPGFAKLPEETPLLERYVCAHAPLVRVEGFGLRQWKADVAFTTFGDVCALLRNGSLVVSEIATQLGLTSFDIVGHSWGGFIGMLTAFRDLRCRRLMPLVTTPDFCDALARMYHLLPPIPGFATILEILQTGGIRRDAIAAQTGESHYQVAWDRISPWQMDNIANRRFEMLICNRAEDDVMRREGVERWLDWARAHGLAAHGMFVARPGHPTRHDMPLAIFGPVLSEFFWRETDVELPARQDITARDETAAAG